ncbi:MAG: bifunctional 23S rRNA (guanine(2069)-N(7))-methyltransferase RlmK/23S rRNA (guanine(2445)-N(2))-methyltransferase RlmL [Spirochaetales bacterium]|nr:bifunctional 23S rRNA (guanine(2069)-N(7))-methyltransferase RlmK/23S rRNA (guanine(2445)-N(2))-methyltransferase RlmL [Spirochaetales bacterium]
MIIHTYFATCPFYLEELLKKELEDFGATEITIAHGGAGFNGSLETAYRACLWSRIANRILFPLVSFEVSEPEDIRKAAEDFDWESHFNLTSTISVDSTLSKTKICTPDYASLSVKDGLVDRARTLTGKRPSVDPNNPDIRLHLHVTLSQAVISIDLSGEGLHKRGYRLDTVRAAVRENTAAAILMRAGWPSTELEHFVDPMCGSGTILIEAAMMAADIAPAINRRRFGFERWKNHEPEIWGKLMTEAAQRKQKGTARLTESAGGKALFFARDLDPQAITAARSNTRASAAAELYSRGLIDISMADFFTEGMPSTAKSGLLAVNPPYGERLNKNDNLLNFYARMGEVFKSSCGGWNICVLTGHKELSESIGLRSDKINTVYNGGIRCTLGHFRVFNDRPDIVRKTAVQVQPGSYPAFEDLSPGSAMMFYRLKKNAKRLKKWLKTSGVSCYRLYDADMPEYSVAVDIYPPNIVIQEYAPPMTIDPVSAASRLREAVLAVQAFLELPESQIHLKTRKRQRGSSQYVKNDTESIFSGTKERVIIEEEELKFLVDPFSYLDTGIFLDSRPIRRLIRNEADGKSFLNLFCYTGTASVHAAAGGALSTLSVDTSKTYLDWAEANMKINGFEGSTHTRVRMDCLEWLGRAVGRWNLIYLDPPTFSNSKDRDDVFDLQKDHEQLIRLTISKLSEGGLLIFCCNFRKFKMSLVLSEEFSIEEITDETIDPDFERKKSIHRCWKIKENK